MLKVTQVKYLKDYTIWVHLDEAISTVSWPNGADFAPEFPKQHIIN